MSPLCQFWANWWVQFAVATGTFAAVLVALFGQAFRAKFFPPHLSMDLLNTSGEKTRVRLAWVEDGQPRERWEDAWYYHLRVSNGRRWSPAQQCQVMLLKVEEPGADGTLVVVWSGDVPLGWRHQEVFPTLRTIGPDASVDLCSVVKGKWLQLHTLIAPHNLEVVRRTACSIVVTVQARANECDSPILRLKISWDGQWHDGKSEMQGHLVVAVAHDPVA